MTSETTVGEAIEETARAAGTLPERVIIKGLDLVKEQAKRDNVLGAAAHGYLQLVHGGLGTTVRTLARFEKASQPPSRRPARQSPKRKSAS